MKSVHLCKDYKLIIWYYLKFTDFTAHCVITTGSFVTGDCLYTSEIDLLLSKLMARKLSKNMLIFAANIPVQNVNNFVISRPLVTVQLAGTAQKMKFSIMDSFSKCDQICAVNNYENLITSLSGN